MILLGVGGIARSREHAEASARLVTEMDPEFLSHAASRGSVPVTGLLHGCERRPS
jgi:hypothetical protein